jgi:hypothetical protein
LGRSRRLWHSEELLGWARDSFHVDLSDRDVALSLAANAIQVGAWRNNSEVEDIPAGAYKRPGQQTPRGLSAAEMMVGNIETARLIRDYLATGDPFWYLAIEGDLSDFDRPYAGTPLTDHVTKKVLAQHRKKGKAQPVALPPRGALHLLGPIPPRPCHLQPFRRHPVGSRIWPTQVATTRGY